MDFEKHSSTKKEGGLQVEREINQEIFERVSAHSIEFDQEFADNRWFSPEEIDRAWQVREWQIGETTVTAIGVSHVPETFLEYREEIEAAIAESDIVVNEYAPEAVGMYSEAESERLADIPSTVNEQFSLDDAREAYIQNERFWNNGLFAHEVELLAAKYNKDMAVADLNFPHDLEDFLQGDHLGVSGAEKIAEQEARLKQAGLYTGAAAAGIASLRKFIDGFKQAEKKMSRRDFLRGALAAGVATAAASYGIGSDDVERRAYKTDDYDGVRAEIEKTAGLRDPVLAKALQQISEKGYKKVAFIYGTLHLEQVEAYLNSPEFIDAALEENKDFLAEHHPDPFRIYRQVPGENDSEKFVASEDMVWDRIDD